MEKIYRDFFRELLNNSNNLYSYVDSLYTSGNYTEDNLNHIFGILKKHGLITCYYADDRAWVQTITFSGKHFFDDETQPRLIVLINQINNIENLFHSSGFGDGVKNVIYDIQEFQDWLQEVNLELRDIYDRTNDHYIWETLTIFNEKLNGRNDKRFFSELRGRLNAIRRNINKYYSENVTVLTLQGQKEEHVMKEKKPKIFISHSSKDVNSVTLLVNLLDGMGLDQTQVFCSSLPGYGIPIDSNIFEYLRNQFLEFDLHVIFIHSENYYKSAVSLNEMGAAWALKSAYTSILLPGFDFKQMVGVVNDQTIAIKITSEELELQDKLNQLYDKIVLEFGLTRKSNIIWEQKRNAFIHEIKNLQTDKENKCAPLNVKAISDGSFEHETQLQQFNLNNIGSISEIEKQIKGLFISIPQFDVRKNVEKSINPFLSPVKIDDRIRNTIERYADAVGITIAPDFFELGGLLKDSLTSNVLTGNNYEGSTTEIQKNAAIVNLYNLILNLFSYIEIERLYSPLSGVQLVLCNDGKTYAEDIDIKLKVLKSAVLLPSELPVPNIQLNLSGEYDFEDIFEIKATKDFISYIDSKSLTISPVRNFYSNIDFSIAYRETIENLFEYKIYDDGDYTVFNCKFDYIKQHQKVAFPTWIFLKMLDTDINISYTIISKSFEDIISGEICVQKKHEESLPDSHLS